MAEHVKILTDETFDEEVADSSLPLLVDFWAAWCGPCKMVAPVVEKIAADHADKLRVAKLNVDDAPKVARRYDILSIPTLMVFKDGVAKKRLVGARGQSQLLTELEEFL